MTPRFKTYDIDLSIKQPTLTARPTLPNVAQNNTDPSAYYTKALGFLPIDTRYLSNTTNQLAYNSVADVLFNKAAWDKRWANSDASWLSEWWAYIPRTVADLGLLFKEKTFDPIAQGITESGWEGFTRGASTALMNGLVNLGNTLDIVSNPIKGLILEGGEGFKKGLFGDEEGRKQYDYNQYIDTGSGFVDFVSSLVLEIVSDPLNWISWGGKAAVKLGTDTIADTAVKSIKEVVGEALENGFKSADEIALAVKSGLSNTAESIAWMGEDTVEAVLKQAFGDSDNITKAMLSNLDNARPMLKKMATNAALRNNYIELAKNLRGSKASRYKASYFNPASVKNAPAWQMLASDYLMGAAKGTLPDLLRPASNNLIRAGSNIYRGVQNFEKGLRYAAGVTGIDEIIALTKGSTKAAGLIRNIRAGNDPNVLKTVDALKTALDIKTVDKVVETLKEVTDPIQSKELLKTVYDIKDEFSYVLNTSSFSKSSVENIQAVQKKLVDRIDELVKKLNIEGVDSYTAYIKYLEDSDSVLKNAEVSKLIADLQAINKVLTEDFSNEAVVKHYKRSVDFLHYSNNKELRAQQQQMDALAKELRDWQRNNGHVIEELQKHGTDVGKALEDLTKVDKLGFSVLENLRSKIIPRTLDALISSKQHEDVITSFKELADAFERSLEDYYSNPADITFRSNLVEVYQDLAARLKSYTVFKQVDDFTIDNASEIYNKLNEAYLKGRSKNIIDFGLNENDVPLLKEADRLERKLASDETYHSLRTYWTEALRKDPYALASDTDYSFADRAIIGESEINKAVDKYLTEIYIKTLPTVGNQFKHVTADVILNKARAIRSTAKKLSQAIEELPEFSVKPLNAIIDPETVSKYKLVIYSVMNRMASVVNRLLGLDEYGTIASRIVESVKITPKVLDDVFINGEFGAFFSYLRDNNKLLKEFEIAPGANNFKTIFALAVKHEARQFLGINSLHSTAGDWFNDYRWMDLDVFARSNKTFRKAWDVYNEALNKFEANRSIYGTSDSILELELKDATERLKFILDEQTKDLPKSEFTRTLGTDIRLTQAESILKMSDEDVAALAKFDTKEIYNYPEAYLSKLLTEYEDPTSGLYKFLNDPSIRNNSMLGSTATSTKALIERLQSYKNLVLEISGLAKANGLEGFYIEGLLDSLMTQLSRRTEITKFNVKKVVDDIMSGTSLFTRNIFDAPATSMDRVLGSVIDTLSKDPNLDEQAKVLVDRISSRLKAGLAHGAVTDVDNLADLILLSQYSNDVRIKDMFSEFIIETSGKRKIVFDIESTGANEASAHVFQIAGKVLDENGVEIEGSAFNFIIKPPKGIKPTPNVLKTLAPQDIDPMEWWNDYIVNAKSSETQIVFDNIEDALEAFTKRCSEQGSVVLVGHNIKAYDLSTLAKRSGLAAPYLNKVDTFDTLRDMNSRIMFQLMDEQEYLFKQQLIMVIERLIAEDSPILYNKPFTYADVKTLSELKQAMLDNSSELVRGLSKEDSIKLAASGFGGFNIDDATDKATGYASGIQLKTSGYVQDLEDIIDGVVNEWRSPSKIKGEHFFIVSKLNPDSFEKQVQDYLESLANEGMLVGDHGLSVKPGRNIMELFTANVNSGSLLINPVRVISYEVEDIFDLKKALDVYKVVDNTNVLRIRDMAQLTKRATRIQRIRNWLPKYYIDTVIDDARAFLKEAEQYESFLKVLYDDPDDITIVAAAIYTYGLLSRQNPESYLKNISTNILKQKEAYNTMLTDYKRFGNVFNEVTETHEKYISGLEADVLAKQEETYTPVLSYLDDDGLPRAIFEEDWQSLDEFVKTIEKDMEFDGIRDYIVGHNLYGLHRAAKHAMLEPIAKIARRIEERLSTLGDGRKAAEQSIKHYNDVLDRAARSNILDRADRVQALKDEMFIRGGYVCFETDYKIDLSDFKADAGFVTIDNVLNTNGKYIQIIAATRETFKAAKDLDIAAVTIKGVSDMDTELLSYIEETRNYLADNVVKNLGYSHGDTLTKETINALQDTLSRIGVSKEVLDNLVGVDDLISSRFFNTVRANNSVVGGRSLWEFISNDSDVFQITDPFKQAVRTIQNSNAERTNLIHYCSLILNKYSDVTDADSIFKKLSDEDLYKLLKKNDDFCMVYITKSGYWDKTKTGLIVKEFDLVNAASVRRAREMGGVHIIPRTQAAELMKSVNEFELPPIAAIAKSISDVYKIAYLGSLGFIIRNIIDSNYKTYASLDGQVSLGKSVSHFTQTLGIVRKHTSIGQEYTKVLGTYFDSDLEYELFYKYCNSFGSDDAITKIIIEYPDKLQRRVIKQLETFSDKFTEDVINKIKPNLIEPELFSIVDAFINYGPSAGLSKTILANIPSASKVFDDANALDKFNSWITRESPARFVYGANDYIEQAARLSMFLQRLELGDTIDDANKAIIKAHFDYADKTIGMLYTEILFPFMSFSYKNLNFWVDMMYNNPMLVGQMENIFRPILDYQGLFEPNQEAYKAYDYTFDWSKDVTSFQANAPWTMINAARLYHILNGNIVIDMNKTVKHDSGYGAKDTDLYTVFKLSPSFLDAVKMLYNPMDAYSERLLPPYETVLNIFKGMKEGNVVEQMNVATLANMLPYVDVVMQRAGIGADGLKHNNIIQRVEDGGPLQLLPSVFGMAYVPHKDKMYYYDSDYNILGGFKQNYYGKRYYNTNPYSTKNPQYVYTRLARSKRRAKPIYSPSIKRSAYSQQYNSIVRGTTDRILRYRIRDYHRYY